MTGILFTEMGVWYRDGAGHKIYVRKVHWDTGKYNNQNPTFIKEEMGFAWEEPSGRTAFLPESVKELTLQQHR